MGCRRKGHQRARIGVATGMKLLRFLRRLTTDPAVMSDQWLKEHQADTRVLYEGVTITFPIRKLENECGWRNRRFERRVKESRRA